MSLNGDDIGQLIYLVILATVIGGYFIASAQQSLGETARAFVLWLLIFLGVAAGYGLWTDIQTDLAASQITTEDDTILIPRSPDGHFYATVEVNGVATRFLVDTGATELVLTKDAAEAAGIDTDKLLFLGTARTANGEVETATAQIDTLSFGPFLDNSVRATVNGGELDISLLGQRYLGRFDRIEITSQGMELIR